jgi:hypothetical protein
MTDEEEEKEKAEETEGEKTGEKTSEGETTAEVETESGGVPPEGADGIPPPIPDITIDDDVKTKIQSISDKIDNIETMLSSLVSGILRPANDPATGTRAQAQDFIKDISSRI